MRPVRVRHALTPNAHEIQALHGRKRLTARALKLKQNWELHGADNTQGLIYFIQATDGGPIKIGRTEWLVRRFYELQNGNPAELVVRDAVPVDLVRLREVEEGLHKRFEYARVRGEWFRPVSALVELCNAVGRNPSCPCGNLNGVDKQPLVPLDAQ